VLQQTVRLKSTNPKSGCISRVAGWQVLNGRLSAITEAYHSAMALATTSALTNVSVTRAEYLEGGSSYCRRKLGMDYERGGNEEGGRTPPPSGPGKVRTRTVSAMKRR
jgi:hypothetical protein